MSIISTVITDGLKASLGAIPNVWLWAGGAAAVLAAAIGVRIYWDVEVAKAADARIAQYVAQLKKDEADLSEITTKNNTKIQIVYQDRVQTITKVIHDNAGVIDTRVPDANTILSAGWVSAFNSSTQGLDTIECQC
jgi:hypothetical protein